MSDLNYSLIGRQIIGGILIRILQDQYGSIKLAITSDHKDDILWLGDYPEKYYALPKEEI